jgi:pimeloyl-ACP methyl ester carboxylesterase
MSRGLKLSILLLLFLIMGAGNPAAVATAHSHQAALAGGLIDFENGVDNQPITSIPGLTFSTDWIYGDWRSGSYNGPYPQGALYSNGNFFARLVSQQGSGRIDINQGCATYLQVGVSSANGLIVNGYDNNLARIATASVSGNPDTGKLAPLRVQAPAGKCLKYVIFSRVDIEWIIDDLSTDAPGVPSNPPPVILLPGLMGSRLDDDDQCQQKQYEVWPAPLSMLDPLDLHLYHLSLAQNGQDPASNCDHIFVNRTNSSSVEYGMLRSIPVGPFDVLEVYGPLIDSLRNYGFDVYPYGYDWRLDLRQSAAALDGFIDSVLSQTGALKVNIVDHSLGGLLARYYVTSDSVHAAKVEQVISLGTPFLGAPKSLRVLRWGDELMSVLGLPLLFPHTVRQISQNMPTAYQVLPTSHYFNVNGGGYYRLDGSIQSLQETRAAMVNQHNSGLTLDAEAFHSSAMDDWSVPLPVAYRLIVGTGRENTPGVIHEDSYVNLFGYRISVVDIEPTNGDGTVPVTSAALQGNGFNYSGGVPIWCTNDLDHGELVKEPYVLNYIASLLASPAGSSLPPIPSQMRTQPYGLDGLQIAAFGVGELHVYDQFGNHIGLNSLGMIEMEIDQGAYETVGDSIFINVPTGRTYTIQIKSSGLNYPDLRLREIKGVTGDLIQRTISYSNIPLGLIGSGSLVYQPGANNQAPPLSIDLDNDGKTDLVASPTGDVGLAESKDWIPPAISVGLSGQLSPFGWYIGYVQVTITATDNLAGVAKTEYTGDFGQTVSAYNGPFTVDASLVSSLIVQAVDKAGNKATQIVNVGVTRSYLPWVRKQQ